MKTVPLGELIATSQVRRAGGADLPVLSMTMHEGLVDQCAKFKKRIASADTSDYKVVSRGQLVVGFPIDEGVLDFQSIYAEGIVSPAYGVWDLKDENSTDRNYMRRFLCSPMAMEYYKAKLRGSTARRRSLPTTVFLELPVPYPSVNEQRRISATLNQSDALENKHQRVLAALGEAQQALFASTFADTKTEALGDKLCFVTSGGRGWAKYYAPQGSPFIRSLDVQMGRISAGNLAYVAAPDNAEARRTRTISGDVLLTITGSAIGRASVLPDDMSGAYISQHVAILRPDLEQLRPEYLAAFLCATSSGQVQIRAAQYGQTKPGLNFDQIRRFRIPKANLHSQDEFCSKVSAARNLAALAGTVTKKFEELSASIQSRAFSGQL